MNLVDKKVRHTKFGEGTITGQHDSCVVVNFASDVGEKKFIYPACFKSFLSLLDSQTASTTANVIRQCEKEERDRFEKKLLEGAARKSLCRLEGGGKGKRSSRGSNTPPLRPFLTVESFCNHYESQIFAEIAYLRANGGKRQRVFDGTLIEKNNGKYLYSFEADSELNYPDGTQITIWSTTGSIPGSIVCCEDFTLIIASTTNLSEKVSSIEFSAEPWMLLNFLIERLHKLRDKTDFPIVQALVCEGREKIKYGAEFNMGQDNACKMALFKPITFVWGPPGTGKTETLAKIALQHIHRGNRVLMLSYSNVSVDGAILRVHNLDKQRVAGKLVRYGYARDKSLLQHEYLTSYNLVIHKHPDLLNERTKLLNERRRFSTVQKASPRYVEIQKRLSQIRNLLLEEEKTSVHSAHFVDTTVSKAIADKTVYEDTFDVVIFDEASMAYIPQIVFSASLAQKHFICMGDFAQLPPIVQNGSDSILNADIFRYCGISDAVESDNGHEWLCLLDTQHRMHPHIADFASMAMYRSLLRSTDGMERNSFDITHATPLADQPLGIADLSGMMSVCTQTADSSRVNPLSALVTFGLALKASAHHEVGIITPYHAQSRLLHAMARDIAEYNPELHSITCATVHQFQGSEKDVIVFDAVDCYRQRYPGTLLTSTSNNYANRLFNVALTRARGKFIAVANISYMENKNLSASLMFAKLLNRYKHSKQSREGKQFTEEFASLPSNCYKWMDVQTGNDEYLQDIAAAKNEIRIDIPGSMSKDEKFAVRLADTLQQAKSRGVKIIIRAEDKKSLPNVLRQFSIQNQYVANAVSLLDKKITWFGEPISEANFNSEGSVLQTKFRPIIRFDGRHTATSLYGFLEMNRTVDQTTAGSSDEDSDETFAKYVSTHKACDKCGKPMKLIKNKGKFFIGCSAYPKCKNTELVVVNFVEKYFYSKSKLGKHCPQDNTSLEAKLGSYGVYVQCCGLAQHKFKLDEI